MEPFLGKRYILKSTENLEEYLKFLGKGFIQRKMGLALRQECWLNANEDGTYSNGFSSPVGSYSTKFTSGVEFQETKLDGVKVKSVITIKDNIMTHRQTEPNGRISTHVKEFQHDKLTVTTTAEGLDMVTKWHYLCA